MYYYNKHLMNFYEMLSRPKQPSYKTKSTISPFELLIIFLTVSKFSTDTTWYGRELPILCPKFLRLLEL